MSKLVQRMGSLETSYGAVSAEMWMVYDTVIHMDVEVECIWKRSHAWVKWAYVFVRYVPLLNGGGVLTLTAQRTFTPSGCRGWIIDQLVVIEVLTVVVEAILVIRLYVLYNRNKVIITIILGAFIAEVILMVIALILVIPHQTFSPTCLAEKSPGIYMMYWLSSLIFETFLFALTLIKFFLSVKRREFGHHSILFVFVRDGTWAYALIFCSMLLNTLFYRLIHTPLAGMGYFWALSVMSFCGSHILLNLRRLAASSSQPSDLPTVMFTTLDQDPGLSYSTSSQSSASESYPLTPTAPGQVTSLPPIPE